jgi:hypothetical protein
MQPMATVSPELRAFLEEAPPYAERKLNGALERHKSGEFGHTAVFCLVRPEIELYCKSDGKKQLFRWQGNQAWVSEGWEPAHVGYRCKNCDQGYKVFALMLAKPNDQLLAMKLGEFPPYASEGSAALERFLGDTALELYRQALRSMRQGLGIGAFAYMRRVFDDRWLALLEDMRRAAEGIGLEDLSPFDAASKEASFDKAFEIVKDAVPERLFFLRGDNPLKLIHHGYSNGLHEKSDEQCLLIADDLRRLLARLVERIETVISEERELHESVKRLRKETSGRE